MNDKNIFVILTAGMIHINNLILFLSIDSNAMAIDAHESMNPENENLTSLLYGITKKLINKIIHGITEKNNFIFDFRRLVINDNDETTASANSGIPHPSSRTENHSEKRSV